MGISTDFYPSPIASLAKLHLQQKCVRKECVYSAVTSSDSQVLRDLDSGPAIGATAMSSFLPGSRRSTFDVQDNVPAGVSEFLMKSFAPSNFGLEMFYEPVKTTFIKRPDGRLLSDSD